MNKIAFLLSCILSINLCANAQTTVPNFSGGPLGQGSWLYFSSSNNINTSIQANYGLNIGGTSTMPVKIFNTSLLVGYPSSGVDFGVNNAYRAGKVGIGTTTPNANLQVVGSILVSGQGANLDPAMPNLNLNYLSNSAEMLIGWNKMAGVGETDFIANEAGGSPGGFAFYNHLNNNIETQLMWMGGDGMLRIGTSVIDNSRLNGANYKLAVGGNILAEAVIVKLRSSWPDYVFNRNYKLMQLKDLRIYLDKFHHLPELSSAIQMTNKGINLGDMNVQLLKKVEELTLYLLEKDNQIQKQEKKLLAQKEINQSLQEQINRLAKKLNH